MNNDVFEAVTAQAIAGYWNTNRQETKPYLNEQIYDTALQASDKISWIDGQDQAPKLLNATTRDAKAIPVDRKGLEELTASALDFKNSKIVNEQDMQNLQNARNSNNPVLADRILNTIYADQTELLRRAALRREAMAMEELTTGQLQVNDNGVNKSVQFPMDSWQKVSVTDWAADGSNPYDDIYNVQTNAANKIGTTLGRAIVNQYTFNKLARNNTLKSTLLANNANTAAAFVPNSLVTNFLYSELGLTIQVYNKGTSESGQFVPFIPNDTMVLLPEIGTVGQMYFIPTSEELEATRLPGTVATVDNGVAIHVYDTPDPVARTTKVTQRVMPILSASRQIAILSLTAPKSK